MPLTLALNLWVGIAIDDLDAIEVGNDRTGDTMGSFNDAEGDHVFGVAKLSRNLGRPILANPPGVAGNICPSFKKCLSVLRDSVSYSPCNLGKVSWGSRTKALGLAAGQPLPLTRPTCRLTQVGLVVDREPKLS